MVRCPRVYSRIQRHRPLDGNFATEFRSRILDPWMGKPLDLTLHYRLPDFLLAHRRPLHRHRGSFMGHYSRYGGENP